MTADLRAERRLDSAAPHRSSQHRLLDATWSVASNDARWCALVDTAYAACAADANAVGTAHTKTAHTKTAHTKAAFVILDDAPDEPASRLRVFVDGVRVLTTDAPGAVLHRVAWEITRAAIDSERCSILVHAGVVARDGRAVVLPAPPDAGKSTLVAALVAAGFDYLSDEAAVIDPGTLRCRPMPRPLGLDPGSWPLFPELAPRDPFVVECSAAMWLVAPDALRPGAIGAAAPAEIAAIVVPGYDPRRPTTAASLPRAEALTLLSEHSFDFAGHGRRGFRSLARLVASVPCRRLSVRELDRAVAEIEALIETAR